MSEEKIPSWVSGIGAAIGKGAAVALPGNIELVTAEQLNKCAVSMSKSRALVMAGLINQLFPAYGITTKDVLHEPLANFLQESLEFQHKVENMNYRAETIVKTWPKRFYIGTAVKGRLDATLYARKPKELAIAVYGGRMGNRPGTDDGWNLRGSGFVGLTGYYVLDAFRKYKGFKYVEEAAAYCRDSDYGALDSALWFFCVLKQLMDEAERDEFIGIVKEINGGTIGLKDRLHYYNLVKKYIG